MACALLGKIDGTVLATRAAKRNHEVFEAAALVAFDTFVDEGEGARKKAVNAFLPVEIIRDLGVFAGEGAKLFFAARIGEAAAIEDKPAAISGIIGRHLAMKAEAEDADFEILSGGSEA